NRSGISFRMGSLMSFGSQSMALLLVIPVILVGVIRLRIVAMTALLMKISTWMHLWIPEKGSMQPPP
ncbi:hypothetical protein L916_05020, partial [Phytophthora nicotianae]